MPSPELKQELRRAWKETPHKAVIEVFKSRGLDAVLKNDKSRHYKITGGVRPVELYASTGTVNAAPYKNRKAVMAKGMMPERAFERVSTLAKLGY